MPLQYVGNITSDFEAVVRSVTSSFLNYDKMNAKIKSAVSDLIAMRPKLLSIANSSEVSESQRNEAVSSFNALWDLNKKNIVDLPIWTEKMYSGPNLPPRIRGTTGSGFSGLGLIQIAAVPITTAAILVISAVAVTSMVYFGARIIHTAQMTKQMKQWALLNAQQQSSFIKQQKPGSGGFSPFGDMKSTAMWVAVGGIAIFVLPQILRMVPKHQ